MEQKIYTQKQISIMFGKSLSVIAHYKKELLDKGYMYKNEKGKFEIKEEGASYLKERFAEIDQSRKKNKNVKEDKIVLEQEMKILQKEKEWYKDKMEYYKDQAEDWKQQAENWKNEKREESKDKEIWREIAIKNEKLLIENQHLLFSTQNKPTLFNKKKRITERGKNERT
ncbi:hypothetical protein [uncultured Clostridium sp.]|uniref:hypothetical protein n=1 Tax=uncultured Clostridium sp. TaxID=59620 RepID=UPI00272A8A18|nr:hypothetical protein [uncultured Clostridium sp.]